MGFFSWDCEVCGHPLLSEYVITDKNAWMNDAVALESDGSVLHGSYDGYGRLDDYDLESPQVYHKACWEHSGKPDEYVEESRSSRDQGYFFEDADHDLPEPQTKRELEIMKLAGDLQNEKINQQWELAHLQSLIYGVVEKSGEEFDKAMEVCQRYVKRQNEKEAKKEANRLDTSVEVLERLIVFLEKNGKDKYSTRNYETINHIDGPLYELVKEDEHIEINLESGEFGKRYFLDGDEKIFV
jgi:hypothetical protein